MVILRFEILCYFQNVVDCILPKYGERIGVVEVESDARNEVALLMSIGAKITSLLVDCLDCILANFVG